MAKKKKIPYRKKECLEIISNMLKTRKFRGAFDFKVSLLRVAQAYEKDHRFFKEMLELNPNQMTKKIIKELR